MGLPGNIPSERTVLGGTGLYQDRGALMGKSTSSNVWLLTIHCESYYGVTFCSVYVRRVRYESAPLLAHQAWLLLCLTVLSLHFTIVSIARLDNIPPQCTLAFVCVYAFLRLGNIGLSKQLDCPADPGMMWRNGEGRPHALTLHVVAHCRMDSFLHCSWSLICYAL